MDNNNLKFLLAQCCDTGLGCIDYIIISFNLIWMKYYCSRMVGSKASLMTNGNNLLSTSININGDKFKEITYYYEQGDVDKLKEMLFDGVENIELHLGSAILGITDDGKQLAVYVDGYELGIEEKSGFTGSSKYANIQTKLSISGKKLNIGILNSSYACDDIDCFRYLNTMDCIAFKTKVATITNREFNHVNCNIDLLNKSTGIKITSLVQSHIGAITGCDLDIKNTVFVDVYNIEKSKINFGNVNYMRIRDVFDSSVVLGGDIHNTVFMINARLRNSVIEFKCDLVERGVVKKFRECLFADRSKFIFTGKVDICILKELIDLLKSIDDTFTIVLNSKVYLECVSKLDTRYAKYLLDIRYAKYLLYDKR